MQPYLLADLIHRRGRVLGVVLGVALGVAFYLALTAADVGFREAARQPLASLLMIEKLSDIVQAQVEAISSMKIDKITVWDCGGHYGSGNAAADFVTGFVKALLPLQEIAAMASIELPLYLGKATPKKANGDLPEKVEA